MMRFYGGKGFAPHTNRRGPRIESPDPLRPASLRRPHARRDPSIRPGMAVAMLILAAFLWGSGNVANKTVLDDIGPLAAVALRCVIAAAVLAPFALHGGTDGTLRDWFRSALVLSLSFAAAVTCQQMAYVEASVTNASFLVNTCTVLTPVFAWVAYKVRIPATTGAAAGMTLLGAWLMGGSPANVGAFGTGDVICLLSAVFYALWMVILGRHAMQHGRAVATTFVHVTVTALLVGPVAIWVEAPDIGAVGHALPELIYLGALSTAAAFGLTAAAQRYVSAPTAAVLVSAESLFGAAGAILILGEGIAPLALAGAALILVAILIVALQPARSASPGVSAAATT